MNGGAEEVYAFVLLEQFQAESRFAISATLNNYVMVTSVFQFPHVGCDGGLD